MSGRRKSPGKDLPQKTSSIGRRVEYGLERRTDGRLRGYLKPASVGENQDQGGRGIYSIVGQGLKGNQFPEVTTKTNGD